MWRGRGEEGRKYRVGDLSKGRSVSQADHLPGETWGETWRGTKRKCQKSMEIRGSVELKPTARLRLEKEWKARARDKPANLQPLHRPGFYTEDHPRSWGTGWSFKKEKPEGSLRISEISRKSQAESDASWQRECVFKEI